jgi:hypothetical protein
MIEEERGLSGNNNGEVFVGFGTKEGENGVTVPTNDAPQN